MQEHIEKTLREVQGQIANLTVLERLLVGFANGPGTGAVSGPAVPAAVAKPVRRVSVKKGAEPVGGRGRGKVGGVPAMIRRALIGRGQAEVALPELREKLLALYPDAKGRIENGLHVALAYLEEKGEVKRGRREGRLQFWSATKELVDPAAGEKLLGDIHREIEDKTEKLKS